MAYSSGKYSYGICDKTGFRYASKDLVFEFRNGSKTGLRVGVDVVDPDHPQNFVGRMKFDDPQSIQDAGALQISLGQIERSQRLKDY